MTFLAQQSLVGRSDLLYFADVCAGPGGFSEYVLSRKKWEAKGFGFTLKGDNDFKLAEFNAGPCESFEPFYGKCYFPCLSYQIKYGAEMSGYYSMPLIRKLTILMAFCRSSRGW